MPAESALKRRYHGSLWTRYFFSALNTRLALPLSHAFARLGFTPNAVSLGSLGVSLVGMGLIAWQPATAWAPATGAALLILGIILDHCDGQVARLTGKGGPAGALLDTIIDRWVEAGWVLALAVGWARAPAANGAWDWPAWAAVAAAVAAVYSTVYVRWANIQRDLYILQREIRRAAARSGKPGQLLVPTVSPNAGKRLAKTFWVPFAFNRDVTLWMLFAVTLSPDWVLGLLAFAALHCALGLEKNYYTFKDLKAQETFVVAHLLDPDYHK